MTEHPSDKEPLSQLRRLAEERHKKPASTAARAMSEQECQPLMHELQVHRIELEMQNEELRVTQEHLSNSLEKYADLFEFAPVGYVTSNQKGRIVEANLTFAGQLGLERGYLINSAFMLYAAESDRALLRAHLEQALDSTEQQRCELRLELRNGFVRHVQLNSTRAESAEGVVLCRTSVTDVSARKYAEEELVKLHDELEQRVEVRTLELRASEMKFKKLSQEFQTLLNAISDTLILLSPEMEIIWINSDESLKKQRAASDGVKQYYYSLLQEHFIFTQDNPITRCFQSAKIEAAVVSHKGAVLDIRAFPILETGRVSSVLLLVHDSTEKMAMQAEAMQAAHMASLGELAAGVAHEINNPITGIINYGQILVNECGPDSLEKDMGTRIVKEGERVGRIVRTLLSFAQQDRRKEKRLISIADVLAESMVLTQAQIRKEGIDLRIHLHEDLPRVEGNFHQIQQVFINIINNARYALNERYVGRHENKRLEITGTAVAIRDRPYVRIIFRDQGTGIAEDNLAVLTKPFFSTKPFGKGTGLGLNITQKIIADHDGRLIFESVIGDFTRVIVELPEQQTKIEAEA